MSAAIAHLHVHSCYSLLEGACRIEELVAEAKRLELPALALTDRNALYGALTFYDQCRHAEIHPIIGMELSLVGGHTAVLLAQEQEGYRNLCRLSSVLQAAPDREAALRAGASMADLDRHRAGLIALSGGRHGEVEAALRAGEPKAAAQAAGRLKDLYGSDNAFIELQIVTADDAGLAIRLAMLARDAGLRCVATHDVHYVDAAGAMRRRALATMRGAALTEQAGDADERLLSPAEMAERFARFPTALEQTLAIAGRCRVEFPHERLIFPEIELPAGVSADEELRRQARAGLPERLAAVTPVAQERLERELGMITGLGYAAYFLVVAEIVRFARRAGIPFSSRGSASSSLVVFALGISDVNPLDHNLYFERFLNPARREAPDIDIDLCSERRDEVIRYVFERFGHERVAMVSTYSTLRARSALREVGKALGLEDARLGALAAQIPRFWHPGMGSEIRQAQADLLAQVTDPVERQALELAQQLEGYPHHLSVHAGGVVIAPGPITDWAPIQMAPKGLPITQFDGPGVERLGLVKIDLLGIRGLSVVQTAVESVRRLRDPSFDLERIQDGDAATGDLLAAGRTIGCFQIESAGMQETLRQLGVRDTAGIVAAISLYRPGPLRGGLKDAFVRRFAGQEEIEYLHPALEPILSETLGVILYQEQVLRIAHEVAGLSLEQADGLRRAMTKLRSGHEMARVKEAFVSGACAHAGLSASDAEQIWGQMQSFAGYGFPKAHAAGYAVVAYRCAYLKAHYPAEYMAARLAEWGGYYGQGIYLGEARRLGIRLQPPHVNHSGREFTLEYADDRPTLWMGLDQVRDVTSRTIERTLSERASGPFSTWEDWLARVQPRPAEAQNLARVGALDGLGATRREMLAGLRWALRHAGAGQLALPLFGQDAPAQDDLDEAEVLSLEEELLGVAVSRHPLAPYADALRGYRPVSSAHLAQHIGREVAVAGLRVSAWKHRTKAGEMMSFLTLEDLEGMIEVVVFPNAYKQYGKLLSGSGPFVVWGHVQAQRSGGDARAGSVGAKATLTVVAQRVLRLEGRGTDSAKAQR